MRRPFFCALDALAINDRSARAGVPPRQLPACHIERVVNAPERAVVVPSVEVVVQGAARRQVLGDRGPLAACAQDVHETPDGSAGRRRNPLAVGAGRRAQQSARAGPRAAVLAPNGQRPVPEWRAPRPHAPAVLTCSARRRASKSAAIRAASSPRCRWMLATSVWAAGSVSWSNRRWSVAAVVSA